MNQYPKISVIIPVFNPGIFIHDCLKSLFSQSLSDFEIICIDDGSTDESLNILKGYAENDPRIIVLSQSNSGQSIARNRGISIAKGEYIFFLDADDYVSPNALKLCYDTAIKNFVDVVYFNGKLFFPNGDTFPFWEKWIVKSYPTGFYQITDNDRVGFFTNVCTTFYKTSFLKENKIFFEENLLYEDLEFNYKVLCHLSNYYWLDESIYFYRRSIAASTTSRNDETSFDLFKAYDLSKINLEKTNRLNFFEYAVSLNVIRHAYGKFARDIFLKENSELSLRYYQKLKDTCNSFTSFYFEAMIQPLNELTKKQLRIIRSSDLETYSRLENKRNRLRGRLIKIAEGYGVKQDLHVILGHCRWIKKDLKQIFKSLRNILQKIISKAISK